MNIFKAFQYDLYDLIEEVKNEILLKEEGFSEFIEAEESPIIKSESITRYEELCAVVYKVDDYGGGIKAEIPIASISLINPKIEWLN